MYLTSWSNSGSLDWTNPSPGKYEYTLALWQAITERLYGGGIFANYTIQPPRKNDILSLTYLNDLRLALASLINSNYYIDVSSSTDLYSTGNVPNSIRMFPKKMDCNNFDGLDISLPPSMSLLNDVKAFYIQMKQALSRLRYARYYLAQKYRYLASMSIVTRSGRGYSNDTLSEAFTNAEANMSDTIGRVNYNDSIKFFTGKWCYKYGSGSVKYFVADTQVVKQIKIRGDFPQYFAPMGTIINYSFKPSDEINSIHGRNVYQLNHSYPIKTVNYWSGDLQLNQGLTLKPIGLLTNNTQYIVSNLNSRPQNPVIDESNKLFVNGSWNEFRFILDWFTPTGFKLQS